MASKVFIDANIILDLTLKREYYSDAVKLFELGLSGNIILHASPSVTHIVGYWLSKTYGIAKAKELLLTLLADIRVIDIPHDNVVAALHSKMKDIEDALQYYTALHHRLDYFITRDKGLVKESTAILPIVTVKEFLKDMQ